MSLSGRASVVVMIVAVTAVAATPQFHEQRMRFVLQPLDPAARPSPVMEESIVVRPHDINVILEQTGMWWMRYYARSDHDRCQLHEQVEMHDLTRNTVKSMAIDGPLPGCSTREGVPPALPKATPASMPSSIARVIVGPLADAAVVQPLAHIAYMRLAPLVPGGAPRLQTEAHYRVQKTEIDCYADARHGTPCPPDMRWLKSLTRNIWVRGGYFNPTSCGWVQPRGDLWYFVELRNPGKSADGTPSMQVKIDIRGNTAKGPAEMKLPLQATQAAPLKGEKDRYALGLALPLEGFIPGDYTMKIHVVDSVLGKNYDLEKHFRIRPAS